MLQVDTSFSLGDMLGTGPHASTAVNPDAAPELDPAGHRSTPSLNYD